MRTLDKIKTLMMGVTAVATLGLATAAVPATYAAVNEDYLEYASEGGSTDNLTKTVKDIINILLGLIGLVTVVMIIFGGFQYVTSQGVAEKVKKAKDTILYGVVGLVVALLAYAIVNFVINEIF